MFSVAIHSTVDDLPKPHIHISADTQISRVLVDAWGCFTDARIFDKFYLGTCGRVLKDIVQDTISLDRRAFAISWRGRSYNQASKGSDHTQKRHKHDGQ